MIGQSDKVVQIRQQIDALPKITISLEDLIREVSPGLLQGEEMRKIRRQLAETAPRDICGLTEVERQRLRERLLTWEAEAEWKPLAFVVVENVATCTACGNSHSHFVGLYQQQKKKVGAVERFVLWAPQDPRDSKLPRKFLQTASEVALCPRCLWEQGFVEKYEGELKP